MEELQNQIIFTCQKCGKKFTEWRKDKKTIIDNPIPKFCSRKCISIYGISKQSPYDHKKQGIILSQKYKMGLLEGFFKGKKHSEETKKKISEIRKQYIKQNGLSISYKRRHFRQMSFGEKWLHNIFLKNKIYEIYDIVSEFNIGTYFVDFAFLNEKVAVEFDGSQHFNKDGSRKKSDLIRDNYLQEQGWRIYRIIHFKYENFDLKHLLNFIGSPQIKKYESNLINFKTFKNYLKLKKEWENQHLIMYKEYYKILKKNHQQEEKLIKLETKKQCRTFLLINHQQGEKNSQFGKIWIYNLNLKENKKIKKEELENYIENGWIKGRKMKFN